MEILGLKDIISEIFNVWLHMKLATWKLGQQNKMHIEELTRKNSVIQDVIYPSRQP